MRLPAPFSDSVEPSPFTSCRFTPERRKVGTVLPVPSSSSTTDRRLRRNARRARSSTVRSVLLGESAGRRPALEEVAQEKDRIGDVGGAVAVHISRCLRGVDALGAALTQLTDDQYDVAQDQCENELLHGCPSLLNCSSFEERSTELPRANPAARRIHRSRGSPRTPGTRGRRAAAGRPGKGSRARRSRR